MAHIRRIQTGKYENYENLGAAIPVGERTCLVCKQNQIKDEQHFLMFCNRYDSLPQELFTCILLKGVSFVNLNAHDKIKYLLTGDNNTCKIKGKSINLMFKKRKELPKV